MQHDCYSPRLDWAIACAREAGDLTLRFFCKTGLSIDLKRDRSPVTEADRQAEQLLRKRIAERYPEDGILGEEFGEQPGGSGFRWILDPIDGTKSFIHGVPLYGTMVAVEHQGRSAVGVVALPALDEVAYAARGMGSWLVRGSGAPERSSVSHVATLAESLVSTSAVEGARDAGQAAALVRLMSQARLARTWGDCYGYVLVATGRAEVMVDPVMNLWDTAAVQPIVEEAGGTFTDWGGTATMYGGQALATNGRVFSEALAALAAD